MQDAQTQAGQGRWFNELSGGGAGGMWHIGPHQLVAGWGTGPDNFYAASRAAALLHFDGRKWTEHAIADAPTGTAIQSLCGYHPKRLFAVGSAVSITHYDGAELQLPAASFVGAQLNGDWAAEDDAVLVAGRDLLARWDGKSWHRYPVDGAAPSSGSPACRVTPTR